MRKISNFTLGLTGLTIIGISTLVCNFWVSGDFESSSLKQSPTTQQEMADITKSNAEWQEIQQSESHKSTLVNYQILPDIANTEETKDFLTLVHVFGNLNESVVTQNRLDAVPPYRLLANMLLRRDEIAYLKTTTISPDMLSFQQIQSCYSLTRVLIADLRSMYEQCNCNHEQIVVMNAALGKLVYLTRQFGTELNRYQAFNVNDLDEVQARNLLVKLTTPNTDN